MRGISFWFLSVAILCGLTGMAFGIHMAAGQDFTLAPAHAHLNLIGLVLCSIYALYYQAVPGAAGKLAWLHLALAAAAPVIMFPGIIIAILDESETLVQIGSLTTISSLALFGIIHIRNGQPKG